MNEAPDTRPSLLVRLRDPRDERAWAEFTAIYSPLINRLACRKGLQEADAADLVQEVLRAVASAIDRWDPEPSRGRFRNWLFTIARNTTLNFIASQRRHLRGTGLDEIRRLLERGRHPRKRIPRCSRSSASASSSGGQPNDFGTSSGGVPGLRSGRPRSKAKGRRGSPINSG